MTIIKDQLIEAQLEVIDNASLPSGRPVGSVYYNKTTEKIQSVKQDGNLRNVYYEDEVVSIANTQFKKIEKLASPVVTSINDGGSPYRMFHFTGLKQNTLYKYTFSFGIHAEASVCLFNFTVNNHPTLWNIVGGQSGMGKISLQFGYKKYLSDSRIFNSYSNTSLSVWVVSTFGNPRVQGSNNVNGFEERPTFMTLEQLPYHQEVGSFT